MLFRLVPPSQSCGQMDLAAKAIEGLLQARKGEYNVCICVCMFVEKEVENGREERE